MAPILLKIKGNSSFSQLASLEDEEQLSKTWRICTKVKDSLENGSRLENLSWRLWHLHKNLLDSKPLHERQADLRKVSSVTTRRLELDQRPTIAVANPGRDVIKKDEIEAKSSSFETRSVIMDSLRRLKLPSIPTTYLENGARQRLSEQCPKEGDTSAINVCRPKSVEESPTDQPPLFKTNPAERKNEREMDSSSLSTSSTSSSEISHEASRPANATESIRTELDEFLTDDPTAYQELSIHLNDLFGNFSATAYLGNLEEGPRLEIPMSNMSDVVYPTGGRFGTTQAHPHILEPSRDVCVPIHGTKMPSQEKLVYLPPIDNGDFMNALAAAGLSSLPAHARLPPSHLAPAVVSSVHSPPILMAPFMFNRPSTISPLESFQSYETTPASINADQKVTCGGLVGAFGGQDHSTSLLQKDLFYNAKPYFESEQPPKTVSSCKQTTSKRAPPPPPLNIKQRQNLSNHPADTSVASNMSNDRQSAVMSVKTATLKMDEGAHQSCHNCGVTTTPIWRRMEHGRVLCNACGLYYKMHKHDRPSTLKNFSRAPVQLLVQPECSNCKTMNTPLW